MRGYYLDENLKKNNTAGAKAPDDIASICEGIGLKKIKMPMLKHTSNRWIKNIEILFKYTFFWIRMLLTVPGGSDIIYQHPTLGKRMNAVVIPVVLKLKKFNFIAVIHDLESLRGGIDGLFSVSKSYSSREMALLSRCGYVISHNKHMTDYLVSKGVKASSIVELELFDYLSPEPAPEPCEDRHAVCIAGNLARGKSGYIYHLYDKGTNDGIRLYLYGNNYEDPGISEMNYMGSFDPTQLPGKLYGSFGLVWDGPDADDCTGNTGNYLKYNNPHKTSLYLSAGIPVIIWEKAAMADFIRANGVGFTISSLNEIREKIDAIPEAEYTKMRANAKAVSDKVRGGYYLKKAIRTVGLKKQGNARKIR